MATKLDAGQKHLLRLIETDADYEGWTPVSKQLFPLLTKTLPAELIGLRPVGDAGQVRLTPLGQKITDAMAWL